MNTGKKNHYKIVKHMAKNMLKTFIDDMSHFDNNPLERVYASLAAGQTVEAYLNHAVKFLGQDEYESYNSYYVGNYDRYYALCLKRNVLLYTFA